MNTSKASVLAITLLLPSWALAAGSYTGEFDNAQGERLEVKRSGDKVKGTLQVKGKKMQFEGKLLRDTVHGEITMPGGKKEPISLGKNEVGIVVELGGRPDFYRRVGIDPSGNPITVPLSKAGPKAEGEAFENQAMGLSFRLPKKWKHEEKDGVVHLLSGNKEGQIFAAASGEQDPLNLHKGLYDLLEKVGLSARGRPFQSAELDAGRAVYVELRGRSTAGQAVLVRAVGIRSDQGSVALVGMAVPDAFDALRARLDRVVRTVRLYEPGRASGK